MPKKAQRNAFYFFMVDFKEEQRKKGINFGKMNEVADAAGPLWTNVAPEIRQKYEAIAKKEKQKHNVPEEKYTSYGVPLSEVERQAREIQAAEEFERKDIKNLVKLKSFNGEIVNEDFYVMDVNYFCKVGNEYLIGESTILRFNLQEGIYKPYHEIINPGYIPVGYASDVKLSANELGLEMPDESVKRSNYMQVLANIIDYLKQRERAAKLLPPIFAMPDRVAPVQDFVQQMCNRAGEDDSLFRIYRLDTLFYTLINAIKNHESEGLPKESLALGQLKKDMFKYTPDIACAHHEESGASVVECTMSKVKRLAFTVLDHCCPVVGVDMQPGKHLPADYDLGNILKYTEQKIERQGPSVAGASRYACNSSMLSDSLNDSSLLNSTVGSIKKETRAPRMPKTDYSQNFRPAPELTETDFPKLTAGAGRGRGMGGSFNRLNK